LRVQVVLRELPPPSFGTLPECPSADLPAGLVMPVGEMVDAALTGLDLGEFATIPSLARHR